MKEGITKKLENTLFIGGVDLTNPLETSEEKREKLRQKELNKNPSGALRDGFNRAENGNLADLVGGLGWKGTGILIIVLIAGYVFYKLFF
jgi:Family of unknown function (DUF6366)